MSRVLVSPFVAAAVLACSIGLSAQAGQSAPAAPRRARAVAGVRTWSAGVQQERGQAVALFRAAYVHGS